jgi:PAS domain-containing protein
MIWLKKPREQSLAAAGSLGKGRRDALVSSLLIGARRRHLGERGKNEIFMPRAMSAIERRALDYFDALEGAPVRSRAAACIASIIAFGFLFDLIPGSVDIFVRDDIFYPAGVISAFLCGVAGGAVAILVFALLAHLGVVAAMLGRPDEPVHVAALFDFLFGSAGFIVLARLPHLLVRARRAMDTSMRVEMEQLRNFVEQAPAAMAMFDRDIHYLGASARWLDARGLDREIVGKSYYAEL